MKKVPTVAEIKLALEAYAKRNYSNATKDEKVMSRRITLPLMEICESIGADSEEVWSFCKKLESFIHCPVTPKEYERMIAFTDKKGLIDSILKFLENYEPPSVSEKFKPAWLDFDIIGYYYCVALISQTDYRAEDCKNMLEKITKNSIANDSDTLEVLYRNMKKLSKSRPFLEQFASEIKNPGKVSL